MQAGYLSEEKYGAASLDSVAGIWAIIAALVISILLAIAANWQRFADVQDTINQGTMGSLLPIFNTASEVGYGAVITLLGICGLSHKQSYGDIFVCAVAIPVVATVVVVVLGSVGS